MIRPTSGGPHHGTDRGEVEAETRRCVNACRRGSFDALARIVRFGMRDPIVDAPGVYVMGLTFMRRRKSSFIHGAEDDVREIALHLQGHLDRGAAVQPLTRGTRAALI